VSNPQHGGPCQYLCPPSDKMEQSYHQALGSLLVAFYCSQGFCGDILTRLNTLYMLCLVVRVPGYTTEMYCVFCEVRTEFIYVM
jgi:hypothetical protein